MLHVFLYYDLSPVLFLFYCFPLISSANLPFLASISTLFSPSLRGPVSPRYGQVPPYKENKKNVSLLISLLFLFC